MDPVSREYVLFWNQAFQQVEEIRRHIENGFRSLEANQMELIHTAAELRPAINVLSSLISSINTLHGHEYVLRLRVLLDNYQRGQNLPDPNVIGFLLERLHDSLEGSGKTFPVMERDEGNIRLPGLANDKNLQKIRQRRLEKRPFKWILFTRLGSMFLLPYRSIEIVDNYASGKGHNWGRIYFTWQGKEHYCRDLLYDYEAKLPDFILVTDGGKRFIPADKIIRRIYSRKDIVADRLEPFKDIEIRVSPGRMRLFGKNCIVL